jgi:DNA-binding NarL/FixJ family response regulator
MSNAKRSRAAAPEPARQSSLTTAPASSAGATATLSASAARCCTPGSDATPNCSGPASPESDRLLARVQDGRYTANVASIAARIAAAPDQPSVHALFRQGVAALGAERAAFVSFVRDDATPSSCRFMNDCDPAWGREYLDGGHFAHDPWLAYAAHHSEPIIAQRIAVIDPEQRKLIDLAERAGFVSALLVPAHSGAGHARISSLCLGSSIPGYFDSAGLPALRVSARMLAMELHDWWMVRLRRSLVITARLTPGDLQLLQHQALGHSSKQIAAALKVSKGSIDSRFQRMNARLGVANRRVAVQVAVASGLILK